MTIPEERDNLRIKYLLELLEKSNSNPIGDTLSLALQIFEELEDPVVIQIAEEAMRSLRAIASKAKSNSRLFFNPPKLSRKISDLEFIQLYRVGMALHELCYCIEMVQYSSEIVSSGSTPTRFYLNGVYNYISSLFLIDTGKPSHKNLPMGGKVIRVLYSLNVAEILDPIQSILNETFGEITFGQAILNYRHSDLVHGDFSPACVEYLIGQTQMRNPNQQELLAQLIWRFFHRAIILYLKVIALLSSSGKDAETTFLRYLREKGISIYHHNFTYKV
jgi:hypothetical protein